MGSSGNPAVNCACGSIAEEARSGGNAAATPKVSVIIPLYRTEVFLRQCVESVLAQTLSDIEVILVDDASPDRCGALARAYEKKDSRVKVVRHERNQGLGAARNTGMNAARGEYVGFVDSDDWAEPEMYEALFSVAVETGAQIVYGGFARVAHGIVFERCEHSFAGEILNGQEAIFKLRRAFYGELPGEGRGGVPVTVWAGLYDRAFLNANNIRFERVYGEDRLFNTLACQRAGRVACAGGMGYRNRKDGQPSLTGSYYPGKRDSVFRYIDRLLASAAAEPEGLRDECVLRARQEVIEASWALVASIESSKAGGEQKAHCVSDVLRNPALCKACAGYPFWRLPFPRGLFWLCGRFGLVGMARLLAKAKVSSNSSGKAAK